MFFLFLFFNTAWIIILLHLEKILNIENYKTLERGGGETRNTNFLCHNIENVFIQNYLL